MSHQLRINQLSHAQVAAVFRSEQFCQLTDRQMAALHHRGEQLKAQQKQLRARRRRRLLVAAGVLALAIAAFPIWHVLVAMGLLVLIWLAVIGWLWDVSRQGMAAITRRMGRPGTQQ